MKQSVHHFWQSRHSRERVLLLLCPIVAFAALLYGARQGAAAWQQLEARMQAILPARPDIATLNQLTGLSLQPAANGELNASADSVEFKLLMNIFISLEQHQRLRLQRQETRLRLTPLELNDVR